ncbi:MAG: hypothetical protein NTZ31_02850 [Actinobacteria bacterium]|nr:hypothetical protein [Actinomycetota bacterium]
MCSAVKCEKCSKVTWSGCGEHIAKALAPYSDDQICKCEVKSAS